MKHVPQQPQKKVTDLMLISRFKNGSIEAFEELIGRYESKVFNLAMRFTRNQEDAEEVLQDVFTTLYRKVAGFEGKSAFSSWLYRIIVNAAFMKLRKRKQYATTTFEELTPQLQQMIPDKDSLFGTPSDSFTLAREIREALQESIAKLPERYRAVFILRDINGLSNQEVGEILDLSVPAVKSRLHRSRIMLQKRLQGYYDEFIGFQSVPKNDAELEEEFCAEMDL